MGVEVEEDGWVTGDEVYVSIKIDKTVGNWAGGIIQTKGGLLV